MSAARQQPERRPIRHPFLLALVAIVLVLAIGYALSRVGRRPAPVPPPISDYRQHPGLSTSGPLAPPLGGRGRQGGAGGVPGTQPFIAPPVRPAH